jgi:hypothetical protein
MGLDYIKRKKKKDEGQREFFVTHKIEKVKKKLHSLFCNPKKL